MNIRIAPELDKRLRLLATRDKKLLQKIQKQLELFEDNPRHPSLRTHKLTGELDTIWSISIDRNMRMLYLTQENDTAYFSDLGTHDEVYG